MAVACNAAAQSSTAFHWAVRGERCGGDEVAWRVEGAHTVSGCTLCFRTVNRSARDCRPQIHQQSCFHTLLQLHTSLPSPHSPAVRQHDAVRTLPCPCSCHALLSAHHAGSPSHLPSALATLTSAAGLLPALQQVHWRHGFAGHCVILRGRLSGMPHVTPSRELLPGCCSLDACVTPEPPRAPPPAGPPCAARSPQPSTAWPARLRVRAVEGLEGIWAGAHAQSRTLIQHLACTANATLLGAAPGASLPSHGSPLESTIMRTPWRPTRPPRTLIGSAACPLSFPALGEPCPLRWPALPTTPPPHRLRQAAPADLCDVPGAPAGSPAAG